MEFAIATVTSAGNPVPLKRIYNNRSYNPYVVNQTHKFFSAFCPRHTHFSTETFLSRTYKNVSSRVREGDREATWQSLIFLSFWQACSRRGPSGFRICAGEPPFGHLPHRSATLRPPPPPPPLPPTFGCRPASPEMTNVTCHGHKGKLHLPPATETGSPSPAMLSRREKKRTEGLFLRRSFILSTSRFMSALAY